MSCPSPIDTAYDVCKDCYREVSEYRYKQLTLLLSLLLTGGLTGNYPMQEVAVILVSSILI
ncbi:MAG: hypothetical protein P8Q37_09170, partial [Porticoccaceae bacterium]|nr:hypothetical protein [Porticoccaceae bacterium]